MLEVFLINCRQRFHQCSSSYLIKSYSTLESYAKTSIPPPLTITLTSSMFCLESLEQSSIIKVSQSIIAWQCLAYNNSTMRVIMKTGHVKPLLQFTLHKTTATGDSDTWAMYPKDPIVPSQVKCSTLCQPIGSGSVRLECLGIPVWAPGPSPQVLWAQTPLAPATVPSSKRRRLDP